MTMKALGFIETIGLVTAFEAADAALKAANVRLLGYENTKGGGRITVKLVGDVGAVNAAIAAGQAAAMRIGRIESTLVIARPHPEIEELIRLIDRGPNSQVALAVSPQEAGKVEAPLPAPAAAPAKPTKPKAAAKKSKRTASQQLKPSPVVEAEAPPVSEAAITPPSPVMPSPDTSESQQPNPIEPGLDQLAES